MQNYWLIDLLACSFISLHFISFIHLSKNHLAVNLLSSHSFFSQKIGNASKVLISSYYQKNIFYLDFLLSVLANLLMKGGKGECLQEFYLLSEEITLALTRGNFSAGFSDSTKIFDIRNG